MKTIPYNYRKRIENLTPTVRRIREQGKRAKLLKDRFVTWEWKGEKQNVEGDDEH